MATEKDAHLMAREIGISDTNMRKFLKLRGWGAKNVSKYSCFERVPKDSYDTPQAATDVLLKHIDKSVPWIEPAAGANALANALELGGVIIARRQDVEPRALGVLKADGADLPESDIGIATNPPFHRATFRRLLTAWLEQGRVCWILQPAGFMHTQWFAKAGFPAHVAEIACLPRLKWIPGSPHTETTDHVWCKYTPSKNISIIFHPQETR